MKITRQRPNGISGLQDTPAAGVKTPASADETQAAEDRVELSEAARLRLRLRSQVGDVEGIDTARVAELRARLAGNTYEPSPRGVAERMLADLGANLLA
jgi:flagellar biosynthesis anti-sigma factor FlgM